MTTQIALTVQSSLDLDAVLALALDGLGSDRTRVAYEGALRAFLAWWDGQGRPAMCKAVVHQYKRGLQGRGLAASTVNQSLSAIKRLVREAADNGLVDPYLAATVERVRGVKRRGQRLGRWLDQEQAQALLDAPNPKTLKGKRDRALLAVLLFAGLRRGEAVRLVVDQLQHRGGWVLLDVMGKHNRVRTVPIPAEVKAVISDWAAAAGVIEGPLFRRMTKGGRVTSAGLTPQAVYDVVRSYAGRCGFCLSPHDARRTFAELSRRGGAGLDQIQLALGHASRKTTERYLNVEQDLAHPPGAHLGLRL